MDVSRIIRSWLGCWCRVEIVVSDCLRRLGISQSAYVQQEAKEPVKKVSREKIVKEQGITAKQLAV